MTLEALLRELHQIESRIASATDAFEVGDQDELGAILFALAESIEALVEAVEREGAEL